MPSPLPAANPWSSMCRVRTVYILAISCFLPGSVSCIHAIAVWSMLSLNCLSSWPFCPNCFDASAMPRFMYVSPYLVKNTGFPFTEPSGFSVMP